MSALWTVRVELANGAIYAVSSALTPAPIPGDVIRYGDDLELDVERRIVGVGVGVMGGRPAVECVPALVPEPEDLVERLRRLRFRLER